ASGKAVRMYGASIDVTERKQADEKLRESEERLRRAIEIETVGVIFFKTDGSITNANDAFLRMSGYSREDLAEGLVRWDKMTPPEWMPHSLKAIKEFGSTGRTIPYEKEFLRKDGSRWWALFAATRLDEEEGVEFIIDITQSKRAEEELRKSGERITNILESITDAFVAVDRQWRFTYLNERALTTLQRTREELLGKNMWEEFPEAVGLPAYREYHRAMTSGNSVHFEEFNPWLDIWVEINAYPSEGGLAIYFRDITERKRAEEERDRLRAREIEAHPERGTPQDSPGSARRGSPGPRGRPSIVEAYLPAEQRFGVGAGPRGGAGSFGTGDLGFEERCPRPERRKGVAFSKVCRIAGGAEPPVGTRLQHRSGRRGRVPERASRRGRRGAVARNSGGARQRPAPLGGKERRGDPQGRR
ncbi:MAG TPA: PAS domain S-box protein, partial [Rubrobacteraceae bacterium]|nr:PAS domain S-box protein [Rubrobacteraceae bacterium]